MFWIICGALVLVVAAAIAAALLRGTGEADQPAAAYDLRLYREQMRDLDRDLARGVVDPAEAERLRAEIGRKLLAADRALARAGGDGGGNMGGGTGADGGRGVALASLVVLLAGAAVLYGRLGAPSLPDMPIARRIAMAQHSYDSRPDQAEAERLAPRVTPPAPDPQYAALIERLRSAVATRPDDPQGLELLSRHEERLGNVAAARKAQERLVAVKGDQATAFDYARLAALTAEAAGGLITRAAEEPMARALALDPTNPQARFMAGMLQIQNGRPDRAFPIWASLLAEGPEDAPWIAPIRAAIEDLAWFADQPDYQPPPPRTAGAPGALPGPDAAAMEAARDMTPEARRQMIEGMVQGLETRLATQGGTAEEWGRLISALVVMDRRDHAGQILAEARTRFAGRPADLATVEAAAAKAGLQ